MESQQQCINLEKIFVPPPLSGYASAIERERENFHLRLQRARRSQIEYRHLFRKLNIIIDQLKEKFLDFNTFTLEKMDNEYEETISYTRSTTTSMTESSSESNSNKRRPKRKHIQMDCNSFEYEYENNTEMENVVSKYPKVLANAGIIILGPNGTQLEISQFEQISWETAAAATRSLLGYVFSSDILATHTLTGKPSPAFRGNRERPPKMQLDIAKTADIIYCVRAKCDSNEREIRAVITTKCADTAKKYKRRLSKQYNNLN